MYLLTLAINNHLFSQNGGEVQFLTCDEEGKVSTVSGLNVVYPTETPYDICGPVSMADLYLIVGQLNDQFELVVP